MKNGHFSVQNSRPLLFLKVSKSGPKVDELQKVTLEIVKIL